MYVDAIAGVCVCCVLLSLESGRGSSQVSLSGTAPPWGCADARADGTQTGGGGGTVADDEMLFAVANRFAQ